MGFRSFIQRLFSPAPAETDDIDITVDAEPVDEAEVHRRNILSALVPLEQGSDEGWFLTYQEIVHVLYVRRLNTWRLGKEMLPMLQQLKADGLIQIIDGGNKDRPLCDVHFTISDNGLNYIGRPGR